MSYLRWILVLFVLTFNVQTRAHLSLVPTGRGLCSDVYQPRLKAAQVRIDYGETSAYDILLGVKRILEEYSRDYFEIGKNYTEIRLPEAMVQSIFKKSFNEVVENLAEAKMYRVELDVQNIVRERSDFGLLLSYGLETLPSGREILYFRIDPRIAQLIQRQKGASYYLKEGLVQTQQY